jgi:hypothetical protein
MRNLVDSLGHGLLDYSDVLVKPIRQILKAHREFADQTERWAEMQKLYSEQTIEWARRQREIFGAIEAVLPTERGAASGRQPSKPAKRSSRSASPPRPSA